MLPSTVNLCLRNKLNSIIIWISISPSKSIISFGSSDLIYYELLPNTNSVISVLWKVQNGTAVVGRQSMKLVLLISTVNEYRVPYFWQTKPLKIAVYPQIRLKHVIIDPRLYISPSFACLISKLDQNAIVSAKKQAKNQNEKTNLSLLGRVSF